uniref:Uncharacterized protein n=1 Tax=Rhodosorus marinus TaxID=101924 RepID=A0A6T6KV68_9RHOD|mmetsp:Transcript_1595/g.2470  ORF Transcript_1595/g.2470 Transcript_1595/m.2470 type:complete len:183 (+) Transcript_1595:290-838(+)
MSPFEVLYGVKIKGAGITQAPLLFDPVEGDVSVQARVKELENLGRTREAVVLSTEAAKRQMARYYDWKVERDPLNIGEYVLLTNQNQTQVLYGHIGPFRVLERRLFDTYRLAEPDGMALKTLGHRDRVKRAQVDGELKSYWYHPTKSELRDLRGEQRQAKNSDSGGPMILSWRGCVGARLKP